MGQTKPAIRLDPLGPQLGHERTARAGKRFLGRFEQIEISLLGLGPKLLDWQVHDASLPFAGRYAAWPSNSA